MDALVLYDANQCKNMLEAIASPYKRIRMVEHIESVEYKRYMRAQAELYFYFISYYWSLLGFPVGYVISQILFVIGIKGTPGATAAIVTTLTAAGSNVVIEAANTAIWSVHGAASYVLSGTQPAPQFQKYDLGKVAGTTVNGMSEIIDTIIPNNIKITTTLGVIVLCTYVHYIVIDRINRARFEVKKSIAAQQ